MLVIDELRGTARGSISLIIFLGFAALFIFLSKNIISDAISEKKMSGNNIAGLCFFIVLSAIFLFLASASIRSLIDGKLNPDNNDDKKEKKSNRLRFKIPKKYQKIAASAFAAAIIVSAGLAAVFSYLIANLLLRASEEKSFSISEKVKCLFFAALAAIFVFCIAVSIFNLVPITRDIKKNKAPKEIRKALELFELMGSSAMLFADINNYLLSFRELDAQSKNSHTNICTSYEITELINKEYPSVFGLLNNLTLALAASTDFDEKTLPDLEIKEMNDSQTAEKSINVIDKSTKKKLDPKGLIKSVDLLQKKTTKLFSENAFLKMYIIFQEKNSAKKGIYFSENRPLIKMDNQGQISETEITTSNECANISYKNVTLENMCACIYNKSTNKTIVAVKEESLHKYGIDSKNGINLEHCMNEVFTKMKEILKSVENIKNRHQKKPSTTLTDRSSNTIIGEPPAIANNLK